MITKPVDEAMLNELKSTIAQRLKLYEWNDAMVDRLISLTFENGVFTVEYTTSDYVLDDLTRNNDMEGDGGREAWRRRISVLNTKDILWIIGAFGTDKPILVSESLAGNEYDIDYTKVVVKGYYQGMDYDAKTPLNGGQKFVAYYAEFTKDSIMQITNVDEFALTDVMALTSNADIKHPFDAEPIDLLDTPKYVELGKKIDAEMGVTE